MTSILHKIPLLIREQVIEVLVDRAANMRLIIQNSFPKVTKVNDRFHVKKLAYESVQEIRIKFRWESKDKEKEAAAKAKKDNFKYVYSFFLNGDSSKKLFSRSRYLFFKSKAK